MFHKLSHYFNLYPYHWLWSGKYHHYICGKCSKLASSSIRFELVYKDYFQAENKEKAYLVRQERERLS